MIAERGVEHRVDIINTSLMPHIRGWAQREGLGPDSKVLVVGTGIGKAFGGYVQKATQANVVSLEPGYLDIQPDLPEGVDPEKYEMRIGLPRTLRTGYPYEEFDAAVVTPLIGVTPVNLIAELRDISASVVNDGPLLLYNFDKAREDYYHFLSWWFETEGLVANLVSKRLAKTLILPETTPANPIRFEATRGGGDEARLLFVEHPPVNLEIALGRAGLRSRHTVGADGSMDMGKRRSIFFPRELIALGLMEYQLSANVIPSFREITDLEADLDPEQIAVLRDEAEDIFYGEVVWIIERFNRLGEIDPKIAEMLPNVASLQELLGEDGRLPLPRMVSPEEVDRRGYPMPTDKDPLIPRDRESGYLRGSQLQAYILANSPPRHSDKEEVYWYVNTWLQLVFTIYEQSVFSHLQKQGKEVDRDGQLIIKAIMELGCVELEEYGKVPTKDFSRISLKAVSPAGLYGLGYLSPKETELIAQQYGLLPPELKEDLFRSSFQQRKERHEDP